MPARSRSGLGIDRAPNREFLDPSIPRSLDPCRRGLSLIELMIAIVILGLGLLMAATMFPIAWTRARDLAEFTTQTAATDAAATTVQLLCDVTGPNGTPATSFLGDAVPQFSPMANEVPADPFVHVLPMENAFVVPNGSGAVAWPENIVRAETKDPPTTSESFISIDPTMTDWIGTPLTPPISQVAFHERVFPPLSPRPDAPPAAVSNWNTQLQSRRFAWAILHKISNADDITESAPAESRSLTLFVVTLRRTQSSHRFARQMDQADQVLNTTEPMALDSAEDMMFPVPWLVNLKVEGNWGGTETGVPSEAVANPGGMAAGRLIAQMLQPGSVLIDYHNGNVYRVKQHRFTGTGTTFDHKARVTLDREILIQDVDDGNGVPANAKNDEVDGVQNGNSPREDRRDFWVFPPPVARDAGADEAFPVFDGRQPVVSVETRQMFFSPE